MLASAVIGETARNPAAPSAVPTSPIGRYTSRSTSASPGPYVPSVEQSAQDTPECISNIASTPDFTIRFILPTTPVTHRPTSLAALLIGRDTMASLSEHKPIPTSPE